MFEGHGKRKSAWAWFPFCRAPWRDPPLPPLCHACTHLPRHGYTGGLVAPMYNHPSRNSLQIRLLLLSFALCKQVSLVEFTSKDGYLFSVYFSGQVPVFVKNWSLDCTWALLAPTWFFGFIRVHHCRKKCMFSLMGNSSWMLSQVSIIKEDQPVFYSKYRPVKL